MPRARVSPEKRKRTARACDTCKRTKVKCNGLQPCIKCSKERLDCTFGNSEYGSDDQSRHGKRQLLDQRSASSQKASQSPKVHLPQLPPSTVGFEPAIPAGQLSQTFAHKPSIRSAAPSMGLLASISSNENDLQPTLDLAAGPPDGISRSSKDGNGYDEEAVVYNFPRLLEDPTGRLQYVGDSATLSYLQIIRMEVESIAGPSPFTVDPRRHRIVENTTSLPQNIRNTHLLPDKDSALILVNAFFTNTSGLVQVFNSSVFMTTLDSCYSDPLHVDPSWLCLFHLTFAIGLVLAAPLSGTREDAIIKKLRADPINRAELFYYNAKNLCDPTAGFEDADFWSIQALLLMTIYMLTVSKRNAAFAYCGMASRSGFALGLHREGTLAIFNAEEQALRRNLWRSVFVVDSFLSASMGRPTAISEDDCSEEMLKIENRPFPRAPFYSAPNMGHSTSLGLEASVHSCRIIGNILKRVYSKRKISTKLAQEIADQCGLWLETLHPSLHWRQMTTTNTANASQSIAILHVNLLYCHTIILLTRPFFLFLLNKVQQERIAGVQRPQRFSSRMEKFSEACVSASCHSIVLVQNALDGSYLSHHNPFVIYFLFAAALIVLSNEFFKLYASTSTQNCIDNSIGIMAYCAETDPLAQRLLFILSSFRDVVNTNKHNVYMPARRIPSISNDPILKFFNSGSEETSPDGARRSSNPAVLPIGPGVAFSNITNSTPVSLLKQPANPAPVTGHSPDVLQRHGSLDGSDILGEGEIDFDAFWRMGSLPNLVPRETG